MRVAVFPSAVRPLLFPTARSVGAAYGAAFQAVAADAEAALDMLRTGTVDVALAYEFARRPLDTYDERRHPRSSGCARPLRTRPGPVE
ncbi:MAG: hypothetical protein ACR2L8_06925 [Solirubrobacteraceae bacterium]